MVWCNFTPAGHKIHCSVTGLELACLLILDCRNRYGWGTAWGSRQMSSQSLWPFQTCSPEDRLSNMISFQRASLLPFLWHLRQRRWRSLKREQITLARLKKKMRVTWTTYSIKCSDEVIRFKEEQGRLWTPELLGHIPSWAFLLAWHAPFEQAGL